MLSINLCFSGENDGGILVILYTIKWKQEFHCLFMEYVFNNLIGYFHLGKMNLGALDATQHQSVGQEYGVQGYPTIKYFAPGSSGNTRV